MRSQEKKRAYKRKDNNSFPFEALKKTREGSSIGRATTTLKKTREGSSIEWAFFFCLVFLLHKNNKRANKKRYVLRTTFAANRRFEKRSVPSFYLSLCLGYQTKRDTTLKKTREGSSILLVSFIHLFKKNQEDLNQPFFPLKKYQKDFKNVESALQKKRYNERGVRKT